MNIRNDRNRRTRHNHGQSLSSLHIVARDSDDISARRRDGVDLSQRTIDVSCLGGGHRLDGDWRPATNRHRTNMNLLRRAALVADYSHTFMLTANRCRSELERLTDVEVDRQNPKEDEEDDDRDGDRNEFGDISFATEQLFVNSYRKMPTIQWEQRQHVHGG